MPKVILAVTIVCVLGYIITRNTVEKDKIASELRLKIFKIFDDDIDTGTQSTYLKEVSWSLKVGGCTSLELGILSEGKWVGDLRMLINYRRSLEKYKYLINQVNLESEKRDETDRLNESREFIDRFNKNFIRNGYKPVEILISTDATGKKVVKKSDKVSLVEFPCKFWAK